MLLVCAMGYECLASAVVADPAVETEGISAAETGIAAEAKIAALEAENVRLEKKVRKMWIVLAFAALSMFAFVYDFMRGEFRRYMDKYLLVASGLKQSMTGQGKGDDPMRKAVDDLFRAQFDTIDDLCRTYYEFEGSGRDAEKIYKEVMAQIRKLTEDRKTMVALEANINKYHGGLMECFTADYPRITEQDKNLFVYVVAGFTSQAISLFIKKDVTAVYRQKHRLKEKIMKGAAAHKEEYLKFF